MKKLEALVGRLRSRVIDSRLDASVVAQETAELAELGYRYDDERYPVLGATESLSTECGEGPSTLAEALLWKMKKWKIYKNFVASYANGELTSTATDVVFSAFALHLRNRKTIPIYDQHALRAVLANTL